MSGIEAGAENTIFEVVDGRLVDVCTWPSQCFVWLQKIDDEEGIYTIQSAEIGATDSPIIAERRSASGEILDRIELPIEFQQCIPSLSLAAGILVGLDDVRDRAIAFNLKTKTRTDFDPRVATEILAADHQRMVLGTSTGKTSIYDRATFEPIASEQIAERASSGRKSVRPTRVFIGSEKYGLTLHVVDAEAGTTVRHSPYAWAAWLMPVTAIAFVAWSLVWLTASVLDGGAPWLDVALLVGIPFCALALRAHAVTPQLLTLHLVQGIVIGASIGACTWVVWAKARLAIRLLTVFIIASFVCIEVYWYFGTTGIGINLLGGTTLFASGFLLLAICARLCGLSLVNPATDVSPRQTSIAIVDYFTVTLGLAVFLPPMLFFVRHINLRIVFTQVWPIVLVVAAVLFAFVFLVMANNKWAFRITCFLVAVLVTLAIFVPWHAFTFGYYPTTFAAARPISATLGMALLTIFATLTPYRLRGWRIGLSRANARVVNDT
ncbi:MAG: hypothetical protein Aurels2KO_43520 [Aureliella sp.]